MDSVVAGQERGRGIRYLLGALAVAVADYATKSWALMFLESSMSTPVLPGLDLVLVFNSGAAFGILADAGGWQRWLFLGAGATISLAVAVTLLRAKSKDMPFNIGLMLILGGAFGNMVDRVRQGFVVDFIDLHFRGWHWPAFNLADFAISTGAILLLAGAFGLFSVGSSGNRREPDR
ncbi:MAG: signal peptidase II [Pseudomonadota bacterium]|nr:signal peptidase II [Pseudomonadota bacterium]